MPRDVLAVTVVVAAPGVFFLRDWGFTDAEAVVLVVTEGAFARLRRLGRRTTGTPPTDALLAINLLVLLSLLKRFMLAW